MDFVNVVLVGIYRLAHHRTDEHRSRRIQNHQSVVVIRRTANDVLLLRRLVLRDRQPFVFWFTGNSHFLPPRLRHAALIDDELREFFDILLGLHSSVSDLLLRRIAAL